MTVMAQAAPMAPAGRSGSLYDTLELILDKGIVIDAFVRVSLIGIEILRVEVRVVIASVDTFLRYAAALGQLELAQRQAREELVAALPPALPQGLTEPEPQTRARARSSR
ncbi:gas vesicle protein GvpJ [Phytohabitans sp. ZYX-F-186]|uniref:Gas vesicle protein A n=1 Tax=Phytohabitans maris TaxID=3071409 RepID=A0ABU0ZTY4_9ACTN|nr:gas vesicle protein GvpJ [Phytohabitans sp. ZYX-F-186]MDQ7910435.1 gas vesicle protein GvpJ [Phytohabitans sp. ZYX-F-186]